MIRSLLRRKSASALLVLEVALGMVVVVNNFVIGGYYAELTFAPTGVDEPNLLYVTRRLGPQGLAPAAAGEQAAADLARLQRIPDIVGAAAVDELPFSDATEFSTVAQTRDWPWSVVVWPMRASDGVVDAFGLHLVRGRLFAPGERGVAIVTSSFAEHLLGRQEILGRRIDAEGLPGLIVVGVVRDFRVRASVVPESRSVLLAADLPVSARELRYVVRSAPGRLPAVVGRVQQALASDQVATRLPNLSAERSHRIGRGAIIIIGWMTVIVVGVALAGALAVASFSVTERTRQIGVRRALGATRADIVRYFLIENDLLTTVGIGIGLGVALPLNALMSRMQLMPKIAWWHVAVSMVLFWAAGLLSTLVPARRAARIPPTAATRTL